MQGTKYNYESDNFENIYTNMLFDVMNRVEYVSTSRDRVFYELSNLTFTLTNPLKNIVTYESRGFNFEFAKRFFLWIIEGRTDITELYDVNENAKDYNDEVGGRNTAYGPRIKSKVSRKVVFPFSPSP